MKIQIVAALLLCAVLSHAGPELKVSGAEPGRVTLDFPNVEFQKSIAGLKASPSWNSERGRELQAVIGLDPDNYFSYFHRVLIEKELPQGIAIDQVHEGDLKAANSRANTQAMRLIGESEKAARADLSRPRDAAWRMDLSKAHARLADLTLAMDLLARMRFRDVKENADAFSLLSHWYDEAALRYANLKD